MVNFELLLSVLGALTIIAMSINAFFLKGILGTLTDLKVSIKLEIQKNIELKLRLEKVEGEAENLKKENESLRFRLHSIEGALKNLFESHSDLEKEFKEMRYE